MSENQYPFSIHLSPGAIETLYALFVDGPLYDGNVPSKQGRDELVDFGLVMRHNGYQQLTKKGLVMCLEAKLERAKERQYQRQRKANGILNAVESFLCPSDNQASCNTADVAPSIAETLKRDEENKVKTER